jgi:hypothetical protein
MTRCVLAFLLGVLATVAVVCAMAERDYRRRVTAW